MRSKVPLKTNCGCEVFVVRFAAKRTYEGLLLGTRELASVSGRKHTESIAEGMLAPAKPLAIVDSGANALLGWTCVAALESCTGVHHDDPDYNSRLYMLFYAADLSGALEGLIVENLKHVDWELMAEDYDIMDF